MGTYNATVLLTTAQRLTPDINGKEVLTRLQPGYIFIAIDLKIVKPGLEEWLQLPNGNWTAAVYPNSVKAPKIFVTYQMVNPTPVPDAKPAYIMAHFPDGSEQKYVPE